MTQPAPDPEEAQAAIEYCYAQGWSDGLPLVPASQPLIDKFLATTSKDPDEVIGELEQVGRNCTVYLAAINAAMAGCLPEYFPVVLAAFDALMRERAARGGGWQSTSGPAPMIVVNGPVRHELGFNTAGGAFGPGFRPNATVARAIGLIVRNAFGIRPHVLEQATQGLPGRWSICLAENEEESPWPPFADRRRTARRGQRGFGDAAAHVRVRGQPAHPGPRAGPVGRRRHDLAHRLADLPRHLGGRGVLPRARADAGRRPASPKHDVQAWLMEHCGRTGADLRRAGKNGLRGIARFADADTSADDTFTRILPSPRHVPIVVAGARNAAISMVVRIFGEWSGTAARGQRND